MLWHKSWLETRSRFLIGLALLLCSAGATVFAYPKVVELLAVMPAIDTGGEIGRRIREAADLSREYRGYVWSQLYRQNLIQLWTIFAVLLGTGGLLSQTAAARLFTLSLPVSRQRLLGARAAAGLAQMLVLAIVPALAIVVVSPLISKSFPLLDALAYALCAFAGSAVLFKGTADLGPKDGGVYDWIGRADDKEFVGFFTSGFYTGVFTMTKAN